MPTWMPYVLANNVASCLGLSSYVNNLKWTFAFCLEMWVTIEAVKFGYRFRTGELGFSTFRKCLAERPPSQYELPSWSDTANQSSRPEGLVSSPATVPARSRSNGFAPQTMQLLGPPQKSSSGFARARGGRMTTYEGRIELDEVNNRFFVDELYVSGSGEKVWDIPSSNTVSCLCYSLIWGRGGLSRHAINDSLTV